MSIEDVISALRVLDREVPVTQRTRQGWRASITASANERKQLCEVHAREASVLTVSFELAAGQNVDDGGIIIAQTRIDEATRERTFLSKGQGFAFNIPAGVTRVFCNGFTKPYTAFVQIAPGIVTTEHVGRVFTIPIGGTNNSPTPAYARTVKVTCLTGAISITVPLGVIALAPTQSAEIPAYQDLTINETSGINAATVAVVWEVTA